MAEREIYNPATGQYELVDDGGIYGNGPSAPAPAVAPTPATPSGPPYTTANPPPAPRDGYEWILNPTTGQFEERRRPPTTNTTGTNWNDPNTRPTDPILDGWEYYWQGAPDNRWGTRRIGSTPKPPPSTPAPSGNFDASGFAWPTFNAPTFTAPTYTPGAPFQAPPAFSYDPFSYDAFQAPEFNDIYKDGSFVGRRDEGLQAIEHGAAAKGLTRLPQTLKALSGWNQDFASREYGNIWDRSADSYDRNRGNAFGNWQANRTNAADAYSLNYGVSRDVWDRGEQQNLSAFDRNYTGARDTFDRGYTGAKDQFDFNQFQPSKLTFDDLYRRWRAELDATTSIATAGAGT